MRSSHTLAGIETTFDEDNLVPNAGLVVPAALAQKLGVAELVDEMGSRGTMPGSRWH